MGQDIYESGEDYLETILRLERRQGQVKSIDIANELNYSKPSISRAMKVLEEKNYIIMDAKKFIHLTEEGLAKAENVFKRHLLIKEVLVEMLGVSPEVAEEDACRVEHILSDETVSKLNEKMEAYLRNK